MAEENGRLRKAMVDATHAGYSVHLAQTNHRVEVRDRSDRVIAAAAFPDRLWKETAAGYLQGFLAGRSA